LARLPSEGCQLSLLAAPRDLDLGAILRQPHENATRAKISFIWKSGEKLGDSGKLSFFHRNDRAKLQKIRVKGSRGIGVKGRRWSKEEDEKKLRNEAESRRAPRAIIEGAPERHK